MYMYAEDIQIWLIQILFCAFKYAYPVSHKISVACRRVAMASSVAARTGYLQFRESSCSGQQLCGGQTSRISSISLKRCKPKDLSRYVFSTCLLQLKSESLCVELVQDVLTKLHELMNFIYMLLALPAATYACYI